MGCAAWRLLVRFWLRYRDVECSGGLDYLHCCACVRVSLVELDGLREGAGAEEPVAHALLRLESHRLGPGRIVEQGADCGAVGGEVERIVEQDSRLPVD